MKTKEIPLKLIGGEYAQNSSPNLTSADYENFSFLLTKAKHYKLRCVYFGT